jgi:hypothetical protein
LKVGIGDKQCRCVCAIELREEAENRRFYESLNGMCGRMLLKDLAPARERTGIDAFCATLGRFGIDPTAIFSEDIDFVRTVERFIWIVRSELSKFALSSDERRSSEDRIIEAFAQSSFEIAFGLGSYSARAAIAPGKNSRRRNSKSKKGKPAK